MAKTRSSFLWLAVTTVWLAAMAVCSAATIVFLGLGAAQESKKATLADAGGPRPEMTKLANALAGNWATSEKMERGTFFPNGGERTGRSHVRLGTSGTTLIWEGHSNGSAGKLDYIIVIWWDVEAKVYRFFTCFNGSGTPCEMRGTAHWEGDSFVNEYEETVKGKKIKGRDVFSDFTATSHTLVWLSETEDGSMKPVVTTRSIRLAEEKK